MSQRFDENYESENVQSSSSEPEYYNLGDPRVMNGVTSTNQDFTSIKQQCMASGTLFEDPLFSPRVAGSHSKGETCEWLRPMQIASNAAFIRDGVSRFDAVQGGVGDCWLVSSVSILASNPRLFARVVPADQGFDQQNGYCGAFHFRFWQYGKWVDVTIDDQLATKDGQLLFMRSSDSNEFWSPLLEKAYAKLHGSYSALIGGTTSEALVDFTGGITEYVELHGSDKEQDVFRTIKKAYNKGSLMGASIEATSEADKEAEMTNGLIKGHAYSITCVTELSIGGQSLRMVRLRNPWSGTSEWKGSWSDQSPEWQMVSEYERRKIGLTFQADGEFWMSSQDFEQNFTRVEICHLSPESLEDNVKCKWHTHSFNGVWIQGISAGGCRNNIDTFATNPQYFITLSDLEGTNECEIIVSLMQKHRRSKYLMGSDQLTIGFAIYEVPDGLVNKTPIGSSTPRLHQQVLTTEFFQYNKSVARTPNYINLREITNKFTLKPGKYCIIPSTYEPNEGDAEFLLRVWTEAPMTASEMDVKPGLTYPPFPNQNPALLSPDSAAQQGPSISGRVSPSYPPYNPRPGVPSGDPNSPAYPPMPEEPPVISISAPLPPPRPNSYPDLEINAEQVVGFISGLAGFLANCLGGNQGGTTQKVFPQTFQSNSSGVKHIGGLMSEGPSINDTNKDSNGGLSQTSNEKQLSALLETGKVDPELFFKKIAGSDGYLDASELQKVLNAAMKKELGYSSFSLDTCKALISAVDDKLMGKLGQHQFESLWADVIIWARAFKRHDKDGNYVIDANELRAAMLEAGIQASRKLLVAIIQRYGDFEKTRRKPSSSSASLSSNIHQPAYSVKRSLSLDSFVHCCVKLVVSMRYWFELKMDQKVNSNRDNSFRDRNRRAFRPESPLSISSQHLSEPYDEDADSVRISLDDFLMKIMYS